jgi:hypothetical protein
MRRAVADLCAVALLSVALPLSAHAQPLPQPDRPDTAPAFQGHAAEAQMRDEASEKRRRRLFFDDVDIEIGPQGLPCDHVMKTKPQAVAGRGHVVVLALQGAKPLLVRVWFPPAGPPLSEAEALARATAQARDRGAQGAVVLQDSLAFAWCR